MILITPQREPFPEWEMELVYCDFHGIVVLRDLYALRLYFVLCLQKYGHILNGNSPINGSCTPSSEKR
jgi:hypothetical protein